MDQSEATDVPLAGIRPLVRQGVLDCARTVFGAAALAPIIASQLWLIPGGVLEAIPDFVEHALYGVLFLFAQSIASVRAWRNVRANISLRQALVDRTLELEKARALLRVSRRQPAVPLSRGTGTDTCHPAQEFGCGLGVALGLMLLGGLNASLLWGVFLLARRAL